MTGAELLAVLAAGFGAGILTSTVGVASLLSFPVLVAVGLPPVVANTTNTLGMTPAGLSGSFGYRRELSAYPAVTRTVLITSGVGAVAGSLLLLLLDPEVFEALAPWLILGTCVLVGIQTRVTAWVRRHATEPAGARVTLSPLTRFFATLTGVYGGYFGAGSGVMMLAVLGFGVDLDFRILNALKTAAVMAANVVASLVFLAIAEIDWVAAGVLAAGSVFGGYVGSHIGRRLPPGLLRSLIVVFGVTAALTMLM